VGSGGRLHPSRVTRSGPKRYRGSPWNGKPG
jgi:hypothetical protein